MSHFTTPMKDLRGYLRFQEVYKLLDAADNPRDKLLVRLLWVTGCRISELTGDVSWYMKNGQQKREFMGLHVCDINWHDHTLILDTLKRRHFPPPQRIVAIDKVTMKMLAEYVKANFATFDKDGKLVELDESEKLFDITRQRALQIMRDLGEKTGLFTVGKKKIHPHHLRHSSCVHFVKKSGDSIEGLRKLQQRLGHASMETTAGYLQFAPQTQAEVEHIFGEDKPKSVEPDKQ